jgi:hypothetical protein
MNTENLDAVAEEEELDTNLEEEKRLSWMKKVIL